MAERRRALSRLQMRILGMLNRGMGRKQIAGALHRSVETVRTRIDQIKDALDVPRGEDIVFTVRRAYDRGYLTGPSPLLDEVARQERAAQAHKRA